MITLLRSLGVATLLVVSSINVALAAKPPSGIQITRPLSAAYQRPDVVDVGAMASDATIPISLILSYRNQDTLDRLVAAQADPSSPLHGQYLTSAQFKQYFAPTDSSYRNVVDQLERRGFKITKTYSNYTTIEASGAVSAIKATFGTDIRLVAQRNFGSRYSNLLEPRIPAALSPARAVTGLTNVVIAHPAATPTLGRHNPANLAELNSRQVVPDVIGGPNTGPEGGVGPSVVAANFDFPAQYGYYGSGRNIGIITGGNVLSSDLSTYQSYFGINRGSAPFDDIVVDGGGTFSSNDDLDSFEATLDTETLIGLAPQAGIYVATAPAPLSIKDMETAMQDYITLNNTAVVSMSYTFCTGADQTDAEDLSTLAEQGNSLGITFSNSSGDLGYDYCGDNADGNVNAPAASPYWVAVGGLQPASGASNFVNPVAWGSGTNNGSSGGCSRVFAQPSWQTGVATGCPYYRAVPDIAFPAYSTAESYNGTWGYAYGTSWSTVVFAALQDEIVQEEGGRVGNAGSAIFTAYKADGYGSIFKDITSGGSNGYSAKTGYDLVTGIGTLDGQNAALGDL